MRQCLVGAGAFAFCVILKKIGEKNENLCCGHELCSAQ